ncbi:MAG: hypothetical protein JNJ83_24350 [Verrucomicrobiaceae bacterium]|nr:hypothetical protein [Verrucomicrobiaceae bacterium]
MITRVLMLWLVAASALPVWAEGLGAGLHQLYRERCREDVEARAGRLHELNGQLMQALGRPQASADTTPEFLSQHGVETVRCFVDLMASARRFNRWAQERKLPQKFSVTARVLGVLRHLEALRGALLPVKVESLDAGTGTGSGALQSLPDLGIDLGWSDPQGDLPAWKNLNTPPGLHDLMMLHYWFSGAHPAVAFDHAWLERECAVQEVKAWPGQRASLISTLHGQYEYAVTATPDASQCASRVQRALEVLALKPASMTKDQLASQWQARDAWLRAWLLFANHPAGASAQSRAWFASTASMAPVFCVMKPDVQAFHAMHKRADHDALQSLLQHPDLKRAVYWGQLDTLDTRLIMRAPARVWSGYIPEELMSEPLADDRSAAVDEPSQPLPDPETVLTPESAWRGICEWIKSLEATNTQRTDVRVQQLRWQRVAFSAQELTDLLGGSGGEATGRDGALEVLECDPQSGRLSVRWVVSGDTVSEKTFRILSQGEWPAWFYSDAWDLRSRAWWWAAGALVLGMLLLTAWRRGLGLKWCLLALAGAGLTLLLMWLGPLGQSRDESASKLVVDLPADGAISDRQWREMTQVVAACIRSLNGRSGDDAADEREWWRLLLEVLWCDPPKRLMAASAASYCVNPIAWPASLHAPVRGSMAEPHRVLEAKLASIPMQGQAAWARPLLDLPFAMGPASVTLLFADVLHGQYDPPCAGPPFAPVAMQTVGVRLPCVTPDPRPAAALKATVRTARAAAASQAVLFDATGTMDEDAEGRAPVDIRAMLNALWEKGVPLDRAVILEAVKEVFDKSSKGGSRSVLGMKLSVWWRCVFIGLLLFVAVQFLLGVHQSQLRWQAAARHAAAVLGVLLVTALMLAWLCGLIEPHAWCYGTAATAGGRTAVHVLGCCGLLWAAAISVLVWMEVRQGVSGRTIHALSPASGWHAGRMLLPAAGCLCIALAILLWTSAPVLHDAGTAAAPLPARFASTMGAACVLWQVAAWLFYLTSFLNPSPRTSR